MDNEKNECLNGRTCDESPRRANIPVYKAADDLAKILQLAGEQVEFSKKKKAPETESASRKKHQPSAVSSAAWCKATVKFG